MASTGWANDSWDSVPFVMFFETAGKALPGAIISSVVVAVLLVLGRWRTALASVLVCALTGILLGFVVKALVGRARPDDVSEYGLVGPLSGDLDSYPSSHTATIAALVVIIALAS